MNLALRRLLLGTLLCTTLPALAAPRLPLLFADGAVLQREQPIPVWGWASPGAKIAVSLDGSRAEATTDAQGHWQVQLPAHAAGGPYTLQVQGDGATLRVADVLVGDVWLASGQSNMEFPLLKADGGAAAAAAANDPKIRHFKVPKSWSGKAEQDLAGGSWQAANPRNAPQFSAVGYFFAQELRQRTGVPIGIIDSTWGGSAIEAWIDGPTQGLDAAALARQGEELKKRDAIALDATRQKLKRYALAAGQGNSDAWREPGYDDSGWDSIPVPAAWEGVGYMGLDGVAWYRGSFTLSAEEARKGVTLGVARVDDTDTTWVNGQRVGHTENSYDSLRAYRVPAAALHAGRNVIAVQVVDTGGGGGIHGRAEELYVQPEGGTRRPLDGAWKFRPERGTVAAIDDKNQDPALLYNVMIHPLQRYPVRGVIWYQGETNAKAEHDAALRYRDQFAALINSWRSERQQPQLPFLWVQLASFDEGTDRGDYSPWALLRESQSKTLALPATGQAVSIDIGNPADIHPTNKRDVGHRLALAARHVAYGEDLVYSGPVFTAAQFAQGAATLRFDLQGSALAVRGGGELQGFALAGADRKFHPAQARIEGDRVVVRSAAVPQPVAVRYAWSGSPAQANLVNREQLPASPFRSDSW
ncbi:MAG TPA: sialate O-acetylesterase [Stenotrophomonas sp.]|nr:sialate O-acetylesterase [Stenotrophomonas sp.]